MFAPSPRFIRAVGTGATVVILLATPEPARSAQLISPGPLDPFCEIALKAHRRAASDAIEKVGRLVKQPSVSAPGFPARLLKRAAEEVARIVSDAGFEHVKVIHLKGSKHPYVTADWLHAPDGPTVVLYAHYDVMPATDERAWKSDPFHPVIRGGRLFGRGAADDKAGVVVHTTAVESYLRAVGNLPVNVRLVIEGEEEIGSPRLADFMSKHRELVRGDAFIIADSANLEPGLPAITTSLRGLVNLEIEIRGLTGPRHSGIFSGPTPDAAMALARLLQTLVTVDGQISIPELRTAGRKLEPAEAEAIEKLPFDVRRFREQAGLLPGTELLPSAAQQAPVSPFLQMWREPTLVIHALQAGSREAPSNIINDAAWARIGVRTVPGMSHEKVLELIEHHLRGQIPWGLQLSLKSDAATQPWEAAPSGPAFDALEAGLEHGYGRKPVLVGTGGSIGIVTVFSQEFGNKPVLLIGVEDPYSNVHGPNESLELADFQSTIRSMVYFFSEYARRSR